jgi:hypothetical protein
MNRWTLRGAELVHLMREMGIRPGPGSPLGDITALPHSGILAPVERQADLSRALGVLAEPKVIFGAMTFVTSEEPAYSWYYGDGLGAGLAYHGTAEEGGSEIVWPVDAPQLLRSLGAALGLEGGSSGDEISLAFDKDGFEALAVAADLAQEMSLIALLNRKGFSGMAFGESEFLECARRSGGSDDLRWTAPRFRLIAPVDLSYGEGGLRRGLRSLEAGGLIRRANGLFEVSPPMGFACAQLSATSGMTALSVRRGGRGPAAGTPGGWMIGHFAALRAGAGLWLLDFSGISPEGFEVRMTNAGPDEVYGRLKAEVGYASRPGFCRRCGGPLREGAAFCPQCGGALK